MSSKFRDQFRQYVVPAHEVERLAFRSGLIVLDANVLLNVYRLAPESRDELLAVIERLRERIWVPHQVGLEFYRNRIQVMADHRTSYKVLREHVLKASTKFVADVSERINHLANRVLLRDEKAELLTLLEGAAGPLLNAIEVLREKHDLLGTYEDDPTLDRLEALLVDRIGAPFPSETAAENLTEAMRRIAEKIPPGYLDADKDEPHGDYFVWAQALSQAELVKAPVLLLVTSDTKDDWYRKINGQAVAAQPVLAEEAMRSAGCELVMMDTSKFLRRAREFVHADVSPETIREAEALPQREAIEETIASLTMAITHIEERLATARRDLDHADHEYHEASQQESAINHRIQTLTRQGHEPVEEMVEELAKLQQRRAVVAHHRKRAMAVMAQQQADYDQYQDMMHQAHAELSSIRRLESTI